MRAAASRCGDNPAGAQRLAADTVDDGRPRADRARQSAAAGRRRSEPRQPDVHALVQYRRVRGEHSRHLGEYAEGIPARPGLLERRYGALAQPACRPGEARRSAGGSVQRVQSHSARESERDVRQRELRTDHDDRTAADHAVCGEVFVLRGVRRTFPPASATSTCPCVLRGPGSPSSGTCQRGNRFRRARAAACRW